MKITEVKPHIREINITKEHRELAFQYVSTSDYYRDRDYDTVLNASYKCAIWIACGEFI